MEVRCEIGSRKIRPLRIKCTGQRPDHVNEKRRLDGITSILATNRKQEGTVDGTGTEISTCLTNKWRVRINQEGLYNVKFSAQKWGGWEKWPKTRASQPVSRRKIPRAKMT